MRRGKSHEKPAGESLVDDFVASVGKGNKKHLSATGLFFVAR